MTLLLTHAMLISEIIIDDTKYSYLPDLVPCPYCFHYTVPLDLFLARPLGGFSVNPTIRHSNPTGTKVLERVLHLVCVQSTRIPTGWCVRLSKQV